MASTASTGSKVAGSTPTPRRSSSPCFTIFAAGGTSEEDLAARHAGLADEVPTILSALDALGLLTETATPLPEGVVTGAQMYRELRRLADRHHDRVVSGPMYRAMRDGSITRQQLIGYALEYYHVVSAAPRLVAPALAKEEPPAVQRPSATSMYPNCTTTA